MRGGIDRLDVDEDDVVDEDNEREREVESDVDGDDSRLCDKEDDEMDEEIDELSTLSSSSIL